MLSNTLFRVPRTTGLQLLQGAAAMEPRASSRAHGSAWRRGSARNMSARTRRRWSSSRRARARSPRRTIVAVPRGRRVCRARHRAVSAAGRAADGDGDSDARSDPGVGAVDRVGGRRCSSAGRRHVNASGRGTYAREVHDIFVRDPHARRLMVGETFNPPGHWSSFPPHKHDGRNGEPFLEEVYYFRVDPPHGFGHQMLYTEDGESVTHQVRDGDAVLLPYGYHPVSSPPGYALYYLWAMAGDERQLALYEDPAHRWIHDQSR